MIIAFLFAGMLSILAFMGMTLAILHILAVFGVGEGAPFTAEHVKSQRHYKGDASLISIMISLFVVACILAAMFL